jgi:hypothetical protein
MSEGLNIKVLATAGVVILLALVVMWWPNNPLIKPGAKTVIDPGWPAGAKLLANTPYAVVFAIIGLIVVIGVVIFYTKGKGT